MNKFFRSLMILLVLFSLSLNISCDIFSGIDPELKDQRNAYYDLVEAHALKQLWLYKYFETFSDNYSTGQLFVYEPTYREIDALWDDFRELMEYSSNVETAIDTIMMLQNLSGQMHFNKPTVAAGVIDAMMGFFGAGSAVKEKSRNRILTISSQMTAVQKQELYDMLRPEWKAKASDVQDFFTKLNTGDFDDEASQMHNDFYHFSFIEGDGNNPYSSIADNKNQTPNKIAAKEGAILVEKGAAIIVEAAKAATPLGAGIDVLEDGRKWWEKAEKAVDKPMDLVKDEIKERLATKLAGMVDVDGVVDVVGLGDGAGTAVKALMEASLGTSDTQELFEKAITWGVAKVTNLNETIKPEVIIAKKRNDDEAFPNIILGVGNYVNRAGEILLALPEGNWSVVAIDKAGTSAVKDSMMISAQQITDVEMLLLDEENADYIEDWWDENDSIGVGIDDIVDFVQQCNYLSVRLRPGLALQDVTISNSENNLYDLEWMGTSFSTSFVDVDSGSSSIAKISTEIDGYISLGNYDSVTLTAHKIWQQITYNDVIFREYISHLEIDAIPMSGVTDGLNGTILGLYFDVDQYWNTELQSFLSSYVSYYYHKKDFSTTDGSLTSESYQDTIPDTEYSRLEITFWER